MRILVLALIIGAALGTALLGAFEDSRASRGSTGGETIVGTTEAAANVSVESGSTTSTHLPRSHSDGDTDPDEWNNIKPNPNLISGVLTRVCTADWSLGPALDSAIETWKTAFTDRGADPMLDRS